MAVMVITTVATEIMMAKVKKRDNDGTVERTTEMTVATETMTTTETMTMAALET